MPNPRVVPYVVPHRQQAVPASVAHATLSLTLIVLLAIAFSLSGCSRGDGDRVAVYPVEGRLTINGQPIDGAQVVFHPDGEEAGKVPVALARTDATGRFELSTYDAGDGAAEGTYRVTVHYYPVVRWDDGFMAAANALPSRYSILTSTTLTATVTRGKNQVPPFDIRR